MSENGDGESARQFNRGGNRDTQNRGQGRERRNFDSNQGRERRNFEPNQGRRNNYDSNQGRERRSYEPRQGQGAWRTGNQQNQSFYSGGNRKSFDIASTSSGSYLSPRHQSSGQPSGAIAGFGARPGRQPSTMSSRGDFRQRQTEVKSPPQDFYPAFQKPVTNPSMYESGDPPNSSAFAYDPLLHKPLPFDPQSFNIGGGLTFKAVQKRASGVESVEKPTEVKEDSLFDKLLDKLSVKKPASDKSSVDKPLVEPSETVIDKPLVEPSETAIEEPLVEPSETAIEEQDDSCQKQATDGEPVEKPTEKEEDSSSSEESLSDKSSVDKPLVESSEAIVDKPLVVELSEMVIVEQTVEVKEEQDDDFRQKLVSAYNNSFDGSFIFKVGLKEVKVSKMFFAVQSEVFSNSEEVKTGEITCDDLQFEAVQQFVNFIHLGSVEDLDDRIAKDVSVLADKYDIKELKAICAPYLVGSLSEDNAFSRLVHAVLHNNEELKSAALEVISKLSSRALADILMSDDYDELKSKNQAVAKEVKELIRNKLN